MGHPVTQGAVLLLCAVTVFAGVVVPGKVCDEEPGLCRKWVSSNGGSTTATCTQNATMHGSRCVRHCVCNHGSFDTKKSFPEDEHTCTGDCGSCSWTHVVENDGKCTKSCRCTGLLPPPSNLCALQANLCDAKKIYPGDDGVTCTQEAKLHGSRCVRRCKCSHVRPGSSEYQTEKVFPENETTCTGDCGSCKFQFEVDITGKCTRSCRC